MNEFVGKVAVVTGAASGIGKGVAKHCLSLGMKVMMADVEGDVLASAVSGLKGDIAMSVVDVSKWSDVRQLAEDTQARFGGVHLLFNNAGVSSPGSPWDTTIDDWTWVMGVNLWGVIHGIKAFVPMMLEQGGPCHIVNTASLAGLVTGSGPATYSVSKHAVVALSENLLDHLRRRRSKVGVSVVCPGLIQTNILDSVRNRPKELDDTFSPPDSPVRTANQARLKKAMNSAMTPEELATLIFQGIEQDQFYILSHHDSNQVILDRARNIVGGSESE